MMKNERFSIVTILYPQQTDQIAELSDLWQHGSLSHIGCNLILLLSSRLENWVAGSRTMGVLCAPFEMKNVQAQDNYRRSLFCRRAKERGDARVLTSISSPIAIISRVAGECLGPLNIIIGTRQYSSLISLLHLQVRVDMCYFERCINFIPQFCLNIIVCLLQRALD
jgi:hypothetical protein